MKAHRSTSVCRRSHTQPAQSKCSETCVHIALHLAVVYVPVTYQVTCQKTPNSMKPISWKLNTSALTAPERRNK